MLMMLMEWLYYIHYCFVIVLFLVIAGWYNISVPVAIIVVDGAESVILLCLRLPIFAISWLCFLVPRLTRKEKRIYHMSVYTPQLLLKTYDRHDMFSHFRVDTWS